MNKRITCFILSIIMFLTVLPIPLSFDANAASSEMRTLHVAVNGNDDTGDGSEENPYATLEKAKTIVRMMNDDMKSNIDVVVHGGTYYVKETLEFTPEDSATNGFRIRYVAADGEAPVISGGEAITGWTLHDAEKNIYKAEGINFDFRQLYVNGEKALRSQSTEKGEYKQIVGAIPKYPTESIPEGGPYFQIRLSEVEGLDLSKAELHIVSAWADNTLRIDHIETEEDIAKVYVKEEEQNIIFNRPHNWIGWYPWPDDGRDMLYQHRYYFLNSYDFLDEDNEWYLDNESETLYYKAPVGTDMAKAEVIAPKVETLVKVAGDSYDHLVGGLTFEGLTFAHSTWTRPTEHGYVGGQASQYVVKSDLQNHQYMDRPPAGVYVACAEKILFKENTFIFMGATALDLEHGTKNCLIKGNTVQEISGNGISVGRFTSPGAVHNEGEAGNGYHPEDKREICTNDTVVNNTVTKVGGDYEGSVAIVGGQPKGLTIANNTIYNVPYTAVSVGWGWGNNDCEMAENKIIRNDISDFMKVMMDGAAIYTLSKQTNSLIAENYIHDETKHVAVWPDTNIYLDQGSTGFSVCDNVIWNTPNNQNILANVQTSYTEKNTYINVDPESNPEVKKIIESSGKQESLNQTDVLSNPILQTPGDGTQKISLPSVFEWAPVFGAENYLVEVSKRSDMSQLLCSFEVKEENTKDINRFLDYGETYYWRVTAKASAAISAISPVFTFTTQDPSIPSAVTGLKVEQSYDALLINWDSPFQSTIKLYRKEQSSQDFELLAENLSGTAYLDTLVEPGKTYLYKACAENDLGTGPASEEVSASAEEVKILFEDSFDTSASDQWVSPQGKAITVSNGKWETDSDNYWSEYYVQAGEESWIDYAVEAEFTLKSYSSGAAAYTGFGLISKASVGYDFAQFAIRLDGSADISTRISGDWRKPIVLSETLFKPGETHKLRMEYMGSKVRVYIDHELVAEGADLGIPEFGGIGIGIGDENLAIDNVRVIASNKLVPVDSVTVSPDKIVLSGVGDSARLTAKVAPADATNREIQWLSENETVAIVDDEGKVTSTGLGRTKILARSLEDESICGEAIIDVAGLEEQLIFEDPFNSSDSESWQFSNGATVVDSGDSQYGKVLQLQSFGGNVNVNSKQEFENHKIMSDYCSP